jgi:hypothetical protein
MSDSSPTSTDDSVVVDTNSAADPAASTTSDVSAAPSPAKEDKPAGTMLDAVKAAIAPKDATPASKSTDGAPAEGEDPDSKTAETTEADELSADEIKALSARTQQRFKKLTKDLKAKDEDNKILAPKAAEFDKIDAYVRNAGLSQNDVAGTLEIAALLRSDPNQALARLLPIVASLQQMTGETLPADLHLRVEQGYLTEADAKTLAKAQAGERFATQRTTALTEQQQTDARNREFKELTTSTVSSVTSWEAQQAARDPDWHLKRDNVAELVELAIERKTRELRRPWFPNSDEAIKLSADALKTVNDRSKRFGPRPTEIKPISNGGASPRSTAVPKTMLDVVRQNAGARSNG